jgi:hypothetical protein
MMLFGSSSGTIPVGGELERGGGKLECYSRGML